MTRPPSRQGPDIAHKCAKAGTAIPTSRSTRQLTLPHLLFLFEEVLSCHRALPELAASTRRGSAWRELVCGMTLRVMSWPSAT